MPMRHRVPMSTWYDQLVGTVLWASRVVLGQTFVALDSESDGGSQGNRLSMCAGLLDGVDLGS